MKITDIAKEFGVSIPTLRKWIYKNLDELKGVVLVVKNKKRNTIRILDEDRLKDFFLNKRRFDDR